MQKIYIKPDKDGKLYITLYGTRYEIIVEETKEQKKKASSKDDVEQSE